MMNFADIWSQFDWVIEDMKADMRFFGGYIPSISQTNLRSPFYKLISRAGVYNFTSSVWSNDTSKDDRENEYTPSQYVQLFQISRIVHLHFYYELETDNIVVNQKLMFKTSKGTTSLKILCYREPILESGSPKEAVHAAISEFRYLKELFGGDALFIGADTLYPDDWLRIE